MTGPDPRRKMVAALLKRGATDEEINDFLDEHRFADPTVPAMTDKGEAILPSAPLGPHKESTGENLMGQLGQALQGATLGFQDELTGVVNAAQQPTHPIKAYIEGRDQERKRNRMFQAEHPVVSAVDQLAGGLPMLFASGGASAAGPLSVLARAAQAAKAGVKIGAVYGLGQGEGDLKNQLESAGEGAAVGGALGGAGSLAGSAARVIGPKLKEAIPNPLRLLTRAGRRSIGRDFLGDVLGGATDKPLQLERDAVSEAVRSRMTGVHAPLTANELEDIERAKFAKIFHPEGQPEPTGGLPPGSVPSGEEVFASQRTVAPRPNPLRAALKRAEEATKANPLTEALTGARSEQSGSNGVATLLPDGQRGWGPGKSGLGVKGLPQPEPTSDDDLLRALKSSRDTKAITRLRSNDVRRSTPLADAELRRKKSLAEAIGELLGEYP